MSECVLCREQVTNPLCMDCVSHGINQWLEEKNLSKIDSQKVFTDSKDCMRCGGSINVCLYCHTKQIYELLKDNKVSQDLLQEFVDYFHFDLDKKGYLLRANLA